MNRFHNPKLFKAAPKRQLSKDHRVIFKNGIAMPPMEAPTDVPVIPYGVLEVSVQFSSTGGSGRYGALSDRKVFH